MAKNNISPRTGKPVRSYVRQSVRDDARIAAKRASMTVNGVDTPLDEVGRAEAHRTHDAAPPNVIGVIEAATCAFNEIAPDRRIEIEDANLFVRLLMAMKP